MKSRDVEAQWLGRLSRFAEAGCTVREWCEREGVPNHQFYYWQRRLRDVGRTPPEVVWQAVDLVSETIPQPEGHTALAIVINNVRIEVSPGFDADTLRQVLCVVEEKTC